MKGMYFTITGMNCRYGTRFVEFMDRDTEVVLVKEPDNEFDKEAIKVVLPGLDIIGYVANSTKTVLGESYSAGRCYDKIGVTAKGKILYILGGSAIGIVTDDGLEE